MTYCYEEGVLQQSSMTQTNLTDISNLSWYTVSARKNSSDQPGWPLIEGVSLWLCVMKCDWLKRGSHYADRAVVPTATSLDWFFIDMQALEINWILSHLVRVKPRNTNYSFQVQCFLFLCWGSEAAELRARLQTSHGSLHKTICGARISTKVRCLDYQLMS